RISNSLSLDESCREVAQIVGVVSHLWIRRLRFDGCLDEHNAVVFLHRTDRLLTPENTQIGQKCRSLCLCS
ncbi:MAG: hypothetical protein KC615_26235, partial [Anaerolineae bacterium]|nr:hypothetical protein [Anaerolineae bacterium]